MVKYIKNGKKSQKVDDSTQNTIQVDVHKILKEFPFSNIIPILE